MRSTDHNKIIVGESLAGNSFNVQFQQLECGLIPSCLAKRLSGSDLDQAGDWYEVRTE